MTRAVRLMLVVAAVTLLASVAATVGLDSRSASAADVSPPTAPTDVGITFRIGVPGDAVLSWGESYDDNRVAAYEIVREGSVVATIDEISTADDRRSTSLASPDFGEVYQLRAVDSSGNRSAPRRFVYGTGFPGCECGEFVTEGTEVTVSTDVCDHSRGCEVLRDGETVGILDPGTNSFTDTAPGPGTYTYAVFQLEPDGGYSEAELAAERVKVLEEAPPTAPTGVTAQAGSDTITLNWGAASDDVGVTNYIAWSYFGRTLLGPEARTFTFAGVESAVHAVKVGAVDRFGNITYSGLVPVTVGEDNTPPSTPDGLEEGVNVRNDNFFATWSPSTDESGIKGYLVFVEGEFDEFIGVEEDRRVSPFTSRGQLTDWTPIEVKAQDRFDNLSGPLSFEMNPLGQIRTDGGGEFAAPTNVAASLNADGSVTLRWDAVGGGATSYLVHRDGVFQKWVSGSDNTSWVDTNVSPGEHTYAVRAQNRAKDNTASTRVTITVPGGDGGTIGTPGNLSGTRDGNIGTIEFTAPTTGPEPSVYLIHVAWDYQKTIRAVAGQTTYTEQVDLSAGPRVHVRAQDAAGNTSPYAEIRILE